MNPSIKDYQKRIDDCINYKKTIDKHANIIRKQNANLSENEINQKITSHLKGKPIEEWHAMYDSIIIESKNAIANLKITATRGENIMNNSVKISLIITGFILLSAIFSLIFFNLDDTLTGNAIGTFEELTTLTGKHAYYETTIIIDERENSPLGRIIDYNVLNEKPLDTAYIAASPGVKLNINYNGASMPFGKIGSTDDFVTEWNSGFLVPIREKLESVSLETNLNIIYPDYLIPESGEQMIIYEYSHPAFEWVQIEATLPNEESKILFLDPAGSWWNETWNYNQLITINNTQNKNFTNSTIMVNLNSSVVGNNFNWSDNSSIRFTYYNKSSDTEINVPYWIKTWDAITNTSIINVKTTFIPASTYAISSGENGLAYLKLYYGNPQATSQSNQSALYSGSIVNAIYNSTLGAPLCDLPLTSCNGFSTLYNCVASYGTNEPNNPNTIDACLDSTSTGTCVIDSPSSADESVEALYVQGLNGTILPGDSINITVMVHCYDNNDRVGIFYSNSTSSPVWEQLTASSLACDLGGRGYKNFSVTKTIGENAGYHAVRGVVWYNNDVVSACPSGTWNDKDDLAFYVAGSETFNLMFSSESNSGYVNSTITFPSQGTNLTRLTGFTLNGTINCARGNCDNVTAELEYYSVTTPTQSWTETSRSDFDTYNKTTNISIGDGYFELAANTNYDPWWDTEWNYRYFINITNNGNNLTDYIHYFNLNNTNTPNNFIWNDNSSLRLATNQYELAFNIVDWNSTSRTAGLLVEFPILANNTNTLLYLYYNNSAASSSTSNLWYYSRTATFNSSLGAPICDYSTTCHTGNLINCSTASSPSELNSDNTIDSCVDSTNGGACHADPESVDQLRITSINGSVINEGDQINLTVLFYCYDGNDNVGIFYTNDTSSPSWSTIYTGSCSGGGAYTISQTIDLNNGPSQAVRAVIDYGDAAVSCPSGTWFDVDDLAFKVASKNNIDYINSSYENLIFKSSGEYLSNIFDTGSSNVQLETIYWSDETNVNTTSKVFARSSSDNISWSSWFQEVNNTEIDASDNRYVQYKVELSTTNENQTPRFNFNNIDYKISSLGWKPIGVGESFTGNANYSCGFLNSSLSLCNATYTITPITIGNFALRINPNSIASEQEIYNKSYNVYSNTYITDFISSKNIVVVNETITLSARLLNDQSQALEGYNITFGDETNNSILGTNITNSQGYAYFSFKIPDSYSIETHYLNTSYEGNITQYLKKSNKGSTSFKVSSVPVLINQTATPDIAGLGEHITLSINATDYVGIHKVWVNITTPKGSKYTYFMNPNGDIYSYDFNDTWEVGTYIFKISANNTDGILSDPPGNFSIVANGTLIADPEKSSYQNFETVYISPRRETGWWNSSWLYRDSLTIQGSNALLTEYQVDFSFDTNSLVDQGKLNADCSDLRFITEKNYYSLPIDITNNLGYLINDSAIKILIQDDTITSHMIADGSDLRVFTSAVESPYSSISNVPFYFGGIQGNRAEIWVKLTLPDTESTRLYLYYGRTDMSTQSNYSAVFNEVIGYAGKTSATSSWNLTTFPINFTQQPIVIGSTTTINNAAESDLRVVNVTTNNVSFKVQESVTLDDVHVMEEIGYVALELGDWLLGGTEIIVNKANIDNAGGNSYHTVNYGTTLSGTINFFGQVQTMNETDPVSVRVDTVSSNSAYLKLEETQSDTAHDYEWLGYVAIPQGIYNTGTGYLQVSSVDTTHVGATIAYTSSINNPLFLSKMQTENGGDNSHERIDNTVPNVAVEEVEAADGAHTTETMAWIAADEGIIYGAKKSSSPIISVGTESIAGSDVTVLDYYLENCNQTNSSITLQVASLPANENTTIIYYYGNPGAIAVSDYYETLLYDAPQTIGYVVSNDLASATLDVYSLIDNNSVSVGASSSTLNKRDVLSVSSLTQGTAIKVTGPVQADSSTDTTDTIVPSVFAGTEFIYRARRYTDEIHLLSPWGNANVTVYDGSTEIYNGIVNNAGYVMNTDITDANTYRVISDIPILAHHLGTNGDTYSLYPATSDPIYGVPGNYLTIGAGPNGAGVTGYLSDDTTTSYSLGVNGSYAGNVGGADGSEPAYKLVTSAINEIIGATQQADSDGGESVTFLPASQMGTLFGAYRSADHIAIAALNENTNCTVYDSTGSVVGSSLSSGNINVSKIGFGTGNDNQYVGSNWIMECNDTVWSYYDEESKQDETALLSWPQIRQYYYPEPIVISTNNKEENAYSGLSNTGTTNISGYLYMAIQYYNSGSWQTLTPPIYQDIVPRIIKPNELLNLSEIWNLAGAWNTGTRNPGFYRVYSALRDSSGNVLEDSTGTQFLDLSDFEIILALLQLNNLTHENKYEASIDEYEVGDLIDWINITIQARNNTAINAEINLTLTNSSGVYTGWGPNSGKSCGNLAPDEYCTKTWNNNSNGYLIPETLPSGSYTFNWQVNATADNGNDLNNNSFTIDIHNIKDTFSASLNPIRIYTTGDPAYYDFGMKNLWSTNLNDINITLNYPKNALLNISCIGGTGDICINSSLISNASLNRSFSISANDSSIPGDYYLNVTVNYTNPNEVHSWSQVLPLLIEVRLQGILAITLNNVPTRINRGESHIVSVYINNTAVLEATNPYINFTLPSGWQNLTPIYISNGTLQPNNILWNNLTINTSTSTPKGHVQLLVESKSDQGQYDFKYFYIDVYANTTLNATHNDTNISRGEVVKLVGRLLYDDGTPVVGESLLFYDETDAVSYGSAITNSSGHAYKNIYVPGTASLGDHIFNISYSGSSSIYTNPSWDTTVIDVGLKPVFNSVWTYPNPQGPGGNVTIYANITDDDIITNVTLKIILPNSTIYNYNMSYSAGLYYYEFNITWLNGTYDYRIIAQDNTGSIQETTNNFIISLDAFIQFNVTKLTYGQNEDVYLVAHNNDWWNHKNWSYKQIINLSHNASYDQENAYIEFILDTASLISNSKMQSDCGDLRIYKSGVQKEFAITNCNNQNTTITLVDNFIANQNLTYELFYGSSSIVSGVNISKDQLFNGTAFVLSTALATVTLEISALYDNTTVCLFNGTQTCIGLNESDTSSFSSINETSYLTFNKAIGSGFTYTASGDSLTPLGFAGKKFSYPNPRGQPDIDVYSPYASANVRAYNNLGTEVVNFNLSKGEHRQFSYAFTVNEGFNVESNVSVLMHYEDASSNYDFMPLRPISDHLYGILGSSSNYDQLSCFYDNTEITVYYSNGTSNTYNCNQGDSIGLPAGGSQGVGPGVYVVSNITSIGGMQVADSDGGEGFVWLTSDDLGDSYAIPQAAEYISIMPVTPSTYCVLYSNTGSILASQTSTSYAAPRPQNVIRFTGSPIPAGSRLVCDYPVYAYYEYNNENAETNLLAESTFNNRPNELIKMMSSELTKGSLISNTGDANIYGYLNIKLEDNISGYWQTKEVLLDDIASQNLRTILQGTAFDLSTVWPGWNTGNSPSGFYRINISLLNNKGDYLFTTITPSTSINEISLFNISPPDILLNISELRIYDVTNNLNKHIYSGDLIDSGLNKTFILESEKEYRIEYDVESLSGSDPWLINLSNISNINLNPSWINDPNNDIWYKNGSDISERVGGTWDGNITWNLSNGGIANSNSMTTFYYLINLSYASAEERNIFFKVDDSLFSLEDQSVFKILIPDTTAPKLYNDIYNISNNSVIRGDSFDIYARWNEELNNATIEYNSTGAITQKENVILPSPNNNNWSNHTLSTTGLWLLGRHVVKIEVSDLLDNWNTTLNYLDVYIYGKSKISEGRISNSTPSIGDNLEINCKVVDPTNSDQVINNYLVTFYNGSGVIGTNFTNSTGWAKYSFIDNTPGSEQLTCNITNNLTNYYYVDSQNEYQTIITTSEQEAPKYSSQSGPSIVHKGDYIDLNVYWQDNYLLDVARLITNASGSYQNVSSQSLTGSDDWANFSYQIPISFNPGYLGWYQEANDTSKNINTTPINSIEVWGWSGIGEMKLIPSNIKLGNTTNISCKVIDQNSSLPLENYLVTFYNGSGVVGTNFTNSTGWAHFSYVDNSLGQENINCTINDNVTLKYNASGSMDYRTLNTVAGSDIFSPVIINGNYGINDTNLFKGASLLIYSEWNESINSSYVLMNSTSYSVDQYDVNPPYIDNWVNYTIKTNSSWLVGNHIAKIVAIDQNGNINNTLAYKEFTLTATSSINWISPTTDQDAGSTELICQVLEEENNQPIENYVVYFYNATGGLLGTTNTNVSGYASIFADTGAYNGSYDFSCKIFSTPAMYYYIGANNQDIQTLYYDVSSPYIALESPADMSTLGTSIVVFNLTVNDDHDSLLDCNLTLDGSVIESFTANEGIKKSISKSVSVNYHYWNVSCLDDSGNLGISDTYEFNISIPDSNAPNVTLLSPEGLIDSNINFTYNVTDESLITNCSLYIDGLLNKTDTSISQGTNHFEISLGDGSHDWNVVCYDEVFNRGVSSILEIVVDSSHPSSFDLVAPTNYTITKYLNNTLSWSPSADDNFDNYTIELSFINDFTSIVASYYSYSESTTFVPVTFQPNKKYYWRVIAYDQLGRATISNSSYIYVTDYSAPLVNLIKPSPYGFEPNGNITFSYSVNDYALSNCSLYTNVSGWGVEVTNNSPSIGANSFTVTDLIDNGTIIWNIYCVDSLGNGAFGINRTLYVGDEDYYDNQTIAVNLTVNNSAPVVNNIVMASPINLLAGTQTIVNCSANISDYNADAIILNSTFYTVGNQDGIDDNNDHYTNSSCSCTSINLTSSSCVCSFSLEYYANAGNWLCNLSVSDGSLENSFTSPVTVNSLRALVVEEQEIDYGDLGQGDISNQSNITVVNLGNVDIDLSLFSYGVVSGDSNAMVCDHGVIGADNQRFSLTSGTSYALMNIISGNPASRTSVNINLSQQTNDFVNSSANIFWRLEVPSSAQGICSGSLVVQAEVDS